LRDVREAADVSRAIGHLPAVICNCHARWNPEQRSTRASADALIRAVPRGAIRAVPAGKGGSLCAYSKVWYNASSMKRSAFPAYQLRQICGVAGLAFCAAIGPTLVAQALQTPNSTSGEVRVFPVQGNVSMVVGAGANITVQAGDDGILLVDTGLAEMSEKVLDAIWPLSKKPLVYIINTSDQADHVGGNEKIGKAGRPVSTAGQVRMFYRNDWLRQLKDRNAAADPSLSAPGAYIIAFTTVLERMSAPAGTVAPMPEAAWPNDTYSETQKNLYFNGEAVQIFHQPGNTDGNSIVMFRRSDVISTGDLVDLTSYPVIDVENGGSIQGVIDGLNRLKQMAVPAEYEEGGTLIVPGHGRLSDRADVAWYQQMVTIVRDRLQAMIAKGMTLEQVKAARPTKDFDAIYGSTTGTWTTDKFIEAAYRSLSTTPRSR
jgi:cyclase